jgi:multisubunit Na+/H+ antiporter MnhB subunit
MATGDAFDALLAAALVWSAWRSLSARDAAGAVVLYIVFGLLAALAWLRLGAPDVALAEAAIGAGITGALLLEAVARRRRAGGDRSLPLPLRPLPIVLASSLTAAVVVSALMLRSPDPGLGALVGESLDAAAASHGVTAVLLDFRAYDTLLEVAVLLVAALALLTLARTDDVSSLSRPLPPELQIAWVARVVAPVAVLSGVYLLALGTTAPGGAFQAGAVLAAAAVLLRLGGYGLAPLRGVALRVLLVAGLACFLGVGSATALGSAAFLDYPAGAGGALVLVVETAIAVSVAATLATLFVGAGARGR